MNKNVFYHYFEHGGMGMGGCECAALDDSCALLPFWEDAINLAFSTWFLLLGSLASILHGLNCVFR